MTPEAVIQITHAAMVLIITLCGPLLLVAMIVGVVVSLFQALTQMQEQTLTFVPKLGAMGLTLLLTLPMIGHALSDFTSMIIDHIIHR